MFLMAEVRLIDANALMKNIGKIPQLRGITYGRMKKAVEETPTIDAVPVVRCGQCAKAKKFHNPQMGDLILCNEYRVFTDECGFCHMGAKMDGGAE